MFKKLFLAGLLAFSLSTGVCYGRGNTIAYVPIDKLTELAATPTIDTDFIPVYDASANEDVKLDVDRFDMPGTETITIDNQAVGFGTATLTVRTTYIISDATGDGEDRLIVPDGSVIGQRKTFVLYVDGETNGTAIAPVTETLMGTDTAVTNGTSTLLTAVGHSVTIEWSGATLGWIIVYNNGGILQ